MADAIKLHIIEKLVDEAGSDEIDESLLEVPPDPKMGDYAFPCFSLSKKLKKAPNSIAEWLKDKIKPDNIIKEVRNIGPYLNFFINTAYLAEQTINDVKDKADAYGSSSILKGKTVLIEFPGPNTNKPLHLGHLRNMALGDSMCNIVESQGAKLLRVNINNDRGVHICKSMLAYQKWGDNQTPADAGRKSDHFVGDFYVMYNEKSKDMPELEEEAKVMIQNWEKGDKDVLKLWKQMNTWAFDGFNQTYKTFGLKPFDKEYYESNTYRKGKDIVMEGLKKGLFQKRDDGAIFIDLEKEGLGEKVLLRPDGTSVYITQDMYLAKLRYDDYRYDRLIYVVATEQNYHFKVLFTILKKLGYTFADNCFHFAYGMVLLPEGKMKSREGTVVDADDLMLEMEELARDEVAKRYKDLDEQEIEDRSKMIGLGALKFYLLNTDPVKDMTFHKEQSISFEGETGPYVQYAHARICSIFRKHDKPLNPKIDYALFREDTEKELIKLIAAFPQTISDAAEHYKPSIIAKYIIDLSQSFSSFYSACSVLKADSPALKDARLALCDATRQVLKNGLKVLGLHSPEIM